jgi:hypothetical protein
MEEAIQYLAKNYKISLSDHQIRKNIEIIEQFSEEEIEKEINKYHRPTFLLVGTSGNYLWGNKQSYYGDVDPGCSALAINGRGYREKCSYSVWQYQNGEINNLVPNKSTRAYIYVDSGWEKFSKEDMEKLLDSGIKEIAIFETNNSIHKEIHKMKPIWEYDVLIPQQKTISQTDKLNWFLVLAIFFGLIYSFKICF